MNTKPTVRTQVENNSAFRITSRCILTALSKPSTILFSNLRPAGKQQCCQYHITLAACVPVFPSVFVRSTQVLIFPKLLTVLPAIRGGPGCFRWTPSVVWQCCQLPFRILSKFSVPRKTPSSVASTPAGPQQCSQVEADGDVVIRRPLSGLLLELWQCGAHHSSMLNLAPDAKALL